MRGIILGYCAIVGHFEATFVGQTSCAVNHSNIVFLHQVGNTLTEFARHRTTVLHQFIDIKANIINGETKVLGLF